MSEVIIPEYIIYTRYGEVMISSNPIIECSIFKNDTYNEPYIIKSKYDEMERANRVSRNLAEMAKSNYDDLKVMYDLLLKEKEELEKKLEIINDSDIKEVLKKRR